MERPLSERFAQIASLHPTPEQQEALRKAAVQLTDQGEFERVALLWGMLHHLTPTNVNYLRRIAQCIVGVSNPGVFADCLSDGCLTEEIWKDCGNSLNHAIRVSLDTEADNRHALLKTLLLSKAHNTQIALNMLKPLPSRMVDDFMEVCLRDETVLGDRKQIRILCRLTERAGHPTAAARAFPLTIGDTQKMTFHQALLGGRIAAQTGDIEKLEHFKVLCRAAALETPDQARESAIYHLLFFDSSDDKAIDTAVEVISDTLDRKDLNMSLFWIYLETILKKKKGGVLLDRIALRVSDAAMAEKIAILADVVNGKATTERVLKSCVDGLWDDPDTAGRLISRMVGQIDSEAELIGALDILGSLDPMSMKILRSHSQQWREGGKYELAAHGWRALVRVNPRDDWGRVNAIYCFQVQGALEAARALTDDWDLEACSEIVLIHAAASFARVGLSEKARELFLQADAALRDGVDSLPEVHRQALARGLILYGELERATAYVPPRKNRGAHRPDPSPIVLLDPGHTDSSGHHANYNIFFSDFVLEHDGVRPEILIGQKTPGTALEGHDVFPAVVFEPYVYNDYSLGAAEIAGLNASFRQELTTLFQDHVPDTLIMHSMRAIMLRGFVQWLEDLGDRRPRRLAIGLIEADHLADAELSEVYSHALSDPLSNLGQMHVETLILFAETTFAVDWLQQHAPGITVHKFPYLAAGRAAQAATGFDTLRAATPVFGILGATRKERGFNPIFQAILQEGAAAPHWHFQVDDRAVGRFGDDTADLLGQIETRIEAGELDQVDILKGFLSDEEYYGAFGRLNCLVLPYSGRYAVSGSGVLYEAVYSRKYLIISEGSTLAIELAEIGYPHRTVDVDDPETIRRAVAETAAAWPAIVDELEAYFAGAPKLPLEGFRVLYTGAE
ncbi:hypothetical protein LCL97_21725 [Seohaeicola saemankumensis]|nr:hypothetical protein [Seohaeicola saemankumensis]MCA0873459.1 hypothetical protein [Seohaeicola saemankumensis]